MDDFLVLFSIGLLVAIAGVLLLKKEIRGSDNSVNTKAKVVTYYDYIDYDNDFRQTMYTMAIEYTLPDGTLIHARERSGSTNQKYPVGKELDIVYRKDKPDFFTLRGDNSRKIIMAGMIVVGIAMIVLALYALQR